MARIKRAVHRQMYHVCCYSKDDVYIFILIPIKMDIKSIEKAHPIYVYDRFINEKLLEDASDIAS